MHLPLQALSLYVEIEKEGARERERERESEREREREREREDVGNQMLGTCGKGLATALDPTAEEYYMRHSWRRTSAILAAL